MDELGIGAGLAALAFWGFIVAWFLTPINNLATVLVVLAKGLRMSWKRAQRASFAN